MTNATVTVTESSPSKQIEARALAKAVVTDDRGRAITLQRPNVLQQYQLVEILGDAATSNRAYMSMVLPMIFVTEINGDRVTARTKAQIEALIQRLDDDGVRCVMQGVQLHFGSADPEADGVAAKK